jgi:hypothetical protein
MRSIRNSADICRLWLRTEELRSLPVERFSIAPCLWGTCGRMHPLDCSRQASLNKAWETESPLDLLSPTRAYVLRCSTEVARFQRITPFRVKRFLGWRQLGFPTKPGFLLRNYLTDVLEFPCVLQVSPSLQG